VIHRPRGVSAPGRFISRSSAYPAVAAPAYNHPVLSDRPPAGSAMIRRFVLAAGLLAAAAGPAAAAGLRFEVRLGPKVAPPPGPGRLLVALARAGERPRFTDTGPPGCPVAGTDVAAFSRDTVAVLGGGALLFPAGTLDGLPAGEYAVQAVFAHNRDINHPSAPGNLRSAVATVRLDPKAGTTVPLTLADVFPEPALKDTKTHKFLSVPSKLLSDFHGRPMVYRVGVALPPDFDKQPDRKYALLVQIGGFGSRYIHAEEMPPDPRFVQILLDGAGPFGDPYQVNSANNGPYGDALVKEVIPYVERTFRCLGTPRARFTTGGSTGGWVSLALQVFYPDYFNGCWSQCPDGVDFRALELIDVYDDANAYVNRFGFERPAKRTADGDTVYTVRHECRIERALGRSGRWELSGRDWACWNAVYGPRGKDGLPVPLWDGETGAIDKAVLKHWRQYDLRDVLDRNWPALGPRLAGKIHVWVGEADDYFLNNAVHRLRDALARKTDPKFDGEIRIELRAGHTDGGWTRRQILDAMAARAGVR